MKNPNLSAHILCSPNKLYYEGSDLIFQYVMLDEKMKGESSSMINEPRHLQPIGTKRGAYSKLSPQYLEIVDYFCYFKENVARLADSSIRRSASCATQFLYHLQEKGITALGDVKEDDIRCFFIKDGKPVYETSYRYRLSEFFESVSGKYPEFGIFCAWMPYIRVTRKNIQYLTDEEVKLVKEVCISAETDLSYLCRAVVLLLLHTGLRGCDVAALTEDSILWEHSKISIIQKKTSVPLTVPMPTVVGNAIYDYMEKERETDSKNLFITTSGKDFKYSDVYFCVKKVFKAAGIRQNKGDRQGAHIFRHHLATSLLENDVAQPVISKLLGHTDPVSIQAYLSADIKHLRDCALSIEDYPLCWEVAFHA